MRLKLSQSRLQRHFIWFASLLIGATVWLCLPAFGISSIFGMALAIAACLLTFGWLWRSCASIRPDELIFRGAGGCWLASIQTLADAESAELPVLVAYQHYFGLHYLVNCAKQSVLLWPDQLDPESARQLRIWIKAQVRH